MSKKSTSLGVLFIERNQISIYSHDLDQVLTNTITEEAYKDLEVVNHTALERQIDSWLETSKLKPQKLIMILSQHIYFAQDFATTLTEEAPEYQEFMTNIPFDIVRSKQFPTQNGSKMIGLSRELIDPFVEVFESLDFSIVAVVPEVFSGFDFNQTPFSKETAEAIITNSQKLLQVSFISAEEAAEKLNPKNDFLTVKFDKKVISLILVFIFLLLILGAVLYSQTQPQAAEPEATPLAVTTEKSSIPTTKPDANVASEKEVQLLSIELFHPDQEIAEEIAEELSKLGHAVTLSEKPIGTGSSSKVLIVFEKTVAETTRTTLEAIIKKQNIQSSVQESSTLDLNSASISFPNN